MIDILLSVVRESWSLLGQMAPYLLFGFLAAGVLSVCISPEFIERHLGGRGFGPVLKAAAFGVPLPLCSCGVIPVSAGFYRHGASRAATIAFLLATPQTGIDSIAVTFALLGTAFAVYRPIIALATGLLGGLLVMLFAQPSLEDQAANGRGPCTESCCADKGHGNVVRRALSYGFVTLPRDIGWALLVGVVVGGGIASIVTPDQWHPYLGGGLLSIVLMMALGVPLYVCASASVPIAAGLIHAGASPGAALAFLIAGPATNAATIATVWKLLGGRTVVLYLLTVAASAVGGGLLFDALTPAVNATVLQAVEHCHEASGWLPSAWALLLLGVLGFSYLSKSKSPDEKQHGDDKADRSSSSERVELAVRGMTCPHCAATVSDALRKCSGVASVDVDLASGRVAVEGERLDPSALAAAVESAGYQAASVAKLASTG